MPNAPPLVGYKWDTTDSMRLIPKLRPDALESLAFPGLEEPRQVLLVYGARCQPPAGMSLRSSERFLEKFLLWWVVENKPLI